MLVLKLEKDRNSRCKLCLLAIFRMVVFTSKQKETAEIGGKWQEISISVMLTPDSCISLSGSLILTKWYSVYKNLTKVPIDAVGPRCLYNLPSIFWRDNKGKKMQTRLMYVIQHYHYIWGKREKQWKK